MSYSLKPYDRKGSEKYGRKIYQIMQNGQRYWLKYQQEHNAKKFNHVHVDGWEREKFFYETHKGMRYLLPNQIVNIAQLKGVSDRGAGLILPHKSYYFEMAPQNIDDAQQRIKQVCDALFQLHNFGYVHGDLKKNHFLADVNNLYMIDFEYTFKVGTPLLGTHATPRYMAPELFNGALKTQESDFYALGIVIYEWLTQKNLYAKSYHDWALLHCQQNFYILPKYYKSLQPILDCMLVKSALQRKRKRNQLKSMLNQ